MRRGVALVLAAAMLSGACAHAPSSVVRDSHTAPGSVASMDSRRDIVLVIANPISPPSPHAGSNLLGYATGSGHYGKGQRAESTLAELKQHYGLREIAGWPIKPLGLYCAVLTPAPGTDRDALLRELAKDARVRLAEPLHTYAVHAQPPGTARAAAARSPGGGTAHYNDPYVSLQQGFRHIGAALAQQVSQGEGVDIAIVDTGVHVAHPDLHGRIRNRHNMVDDDAAAFNRDRHGTEVAGIIAANSDNHLGIVGIAPKATLSIYKACWYPSDARAGARCNTFTLAKALSALVDTDIRIINLSLSGPADPLLTRLLTVLLDQNRIVVAAMPSGADLDGFPADTPGVIVVRASAAPDAPAGVLSAPGKDILTTQPNGRYDFTSGSSMAAAHVSGIAALLLSLAPDLGADELRNLLRRSSRISDGNLQVNAASALVPLTAMRKARLVEMNSP